MSPALAYGPKHGPVDPRLGKPLCRAHHQRQELGIEIGDRFSYADVLEATELHNSYSKSPLPIPERGDYP